MILAGDVGGTKAELALFAPEGPLRGRCLWRTRTDLHGGVEDLLAQYLRSPRVRSLGSPEVLSLAVAGPVLGGRVHMVNLGWRFAAQELAERFGFRRVHLLNDLEALALAVPSLRAGDLVRLKPGRRDPRGNIAVLAAGTGLGESFLVRKGVSRPVPVATEGGHAELFALDETTWALCAFLQRRFGHASLERAVSGPGLENIHAFLSHRRGQAEELPAREITRRAQEGDGTAREAVEIWVRLFAAEAANAALRCLATGGVYLGGGVTTHLLPFLQGETFRETFLRKGRLSGFLKGIPVFAVRHPHAVLRGAALCARQGAL